MYISGNYASFGKRSRHPQAVDGLVIDFDETFTNPFVNIDGKALHAYDMSRIAAANFLGAILQNEFLMNVGPDISAQSFRESKSANTETSLAWLLCKAEIFEHPHKYDREDTRLRKFIELYDETHDSIIRKHVQPNAGAVELIRFVDGETPYGVAIASQAYKKHIDHVLERTGVADAIPEHRRISAEVATVPKPDPMAFDLAFLSLQTKDGVAIEDTPEQRRRVIGLDDSIAGVESAHTSGLTAIGYAANFGVQKFKESKARFAFSNHYDLLEYIKTVNKYKPRRYL